MSNHWLKILALILTPIVLIDFSASAQSKDTKIGTATVSGRVTIKGEPANGIAVFLLPQQGIQSENSPTLPNAKTDANGNFRITNVMPGRYITNPHVPGYIIPGAPYGFWQGKTINVAEGENIEKIEIALIRGSIITGRVTDANGRPVVDAWMGLIKLDNSGKPQQVNLAPDQLIPTDDRGIYRIFSLQEGRYLVSIGSSQSGVKMGGGAQYQKTFHPDVTDQSQAKVVEVDEGEEVIGVDIKVLSVIKTYSIFGRVVNAENGQPVAGASINIGRFSTDGNGTSSSGPYGIRSNSAGEFQLSNVAPGKYAVFTLSD